MLAVGSGDDAVSFGFESVGEADAERGFVFDEKDAGGIGLHWRILQEVRRLGWMGGLVWFSTQSRRGRGVNTEDGLVWFLRFEQKVAKGRKQKVAKEAKSGLDGMLSLRKKMCWKGFGF